jgi:hypothetical protein
MLKINGLSMSKFMTIWNNRTKLLHENKNFVATDKVRILKVLTKKIDNTK